jgi:cytochrome c-type biogenesis protein CcmH
VNRRLISVALPLVLLAGLFLIPAVSAQDVYSDRTMELARQLQCPVCDGQAVADSQVTLARQMRDVIEQKVQAGETDEQIMAYFTARYGQNVLLDPPKSGFNLTLWWIPPAVLLVGGLVVFLYMREGKSGSSDARREVVVEAVDPELEEIAREYLNSDANARRS